MQRAKGTERLLEVLDCVIDQDQPNDLVPLRALNENRIDTLFRAAAEATQEAVLNAMIAAPATTGRDGHHRPSLRDWLRANAS